MASQNILEVQHLQKSFGRHDVLKDICFSVRQGEIIGLLGKNGEGKTTMMKSILGLLNHSGTVLFDGRPLDPTDWRAMNSIGVLVDTAFFEDMTANDNLKVLMLSTPGRDNSHLRKDIASLLSFVGLEDNGRDKVKGFSFGMKQRLALAQALISEPKLLILDEPFVGLDPLGVVLVKDKLIELCREKKTSIIFSSHQLTEVAELAEDLVVIENGYVKYFGTYADLERRNKEYRIITDKIVSPAILQELTTRGIAVTAVEGKPHIVLSHGETSLDPLLRHLQSSGYTICEIIREDRPLETLFA